jgi:hypothetical protein
VAAALVVLAGAVVVAVDRASRDSTPTGGDRPSAASSAAGGPGAGTTAPGERVAGPPPSARPATIEGAEAFVRYWFDALNEAVRTGSTAELEAASSPDCQVCGNAVRTVRDGYADDATLRGGVYVVRDAEADGFWNPERPTLHVVLDRSPRSTVTRDGQSTGSLPGVTFLPCQVLLVRAGDQWLVREVLSNTQVV